MHRNIAPEGCLRSFPSNISTTLLLSTPQVAGCGGANAVVLLLLLPPKLLHVVRVAHLGFKGFSLETVYKNEIIMDYMVVALHPEILPMKQQSRFI